MTPAVRSWLFLGGALFAFAASAALVAGSVSATRKDRDLRFGIEELDSLIAAARTTGDATLDEAAAMAPWLARRARTAPQALGVLRRSLEIADLSGSYDVLHGAASAALEEFPGNTDIRAVAVYAAVRAREPGVGIERAEPLANTRPTFYAWALLSAGTTATGGEEELLLASLARDAPAADFERAWRLTGDQRYAIDAALLHLASGAAEEAERVAVEAALSLRAPRFMADLLQDRGRYTDAIAALERVAESGADAADLSLRIADLLLLAGRPGEAREQYERLLAEPDAPPVAFVNAAALAEHAETAAALIDEGRDRFPDSWELARSAALLGRPLGSWDGTPHEGRARLLELRLDPRPDRRGFAAELWTLVRSHPELLVATDGTGRFAAWYFASRELMDDLEMLLDTVDATVGSNAAPPAWAGLYRGVAAARARRWPEALDHFETSFRRSPTWEAALNAAIAHLRLGRRSRAEARLQDAALLARAGTGRARATVFIAAARLATDRDEQRAFVEEAIAIAPDSAEALLLATQLGDCRRNCGR